MNSHSKSGFDPATAKILKFFLQHEELSAETIADALSMNPEEVRSSIVQLRASGMIQESTNHGAHSITPSGRFLIVKGGLAQREKPKQPVSDGIEA